MPSIQTETIQLHYDTFGDPSDPAMVLVMGLSMQMIAWPEELCEALAAEGFYVIRFDNRDIGLSEKMHGQRAPSAIQVVLRKALGLPVTVPYTLHDMARDTVGLLDALKVEKAHLVGASMGGMISQLVAATYGDRTHTLTSIMSMSGKTRHLRPRLKVLRQMLFRRPRSGDEEDMLAYGLKLWELIGSPAYPIPPEVTRERILRGLQRSHYPQGFLRQIAAILATGDRTSLLRTIQVPTLVIHGTHDPLVPLAGGRATARAIPNAQLQEIPGMGHNLPPQLLPQLTRLVVDHARKVT